VKRSASAVTAQQWLEPHAIERTSDTPGTRTWLGLGLGLGLGLELGLGLGLGLGLANPNPGTRTGMSRATVASAPLPSPSWLESARPQPYTSPAAVRASLGVDSRTD